MAPFQQLLAQCIVLPVLMAMAVDSNIPLDTGKQELIANRENLVPSLESLKPEQIHISLGDTSTDMTIMWATKGYDISFVEYHTGDRQLAKKVEGTTLKLETGNEEGAKYLHHVALHNLTPQTKYYYHVRGDSEDTLSDQYSFTVPPVLAGNTHTFMVYGDLGTKSKDLQFLLQEARNDRYGAIFHLGDIAFDLHSEQGKVGDKFLSLMENVAATIPYMTTPGDHEHFEQYLHYRYRFSMPNLPWPMPSNKLWYSIDIGPVHFVVYSTEVFFHDDENIDSMLEWLKEDLDKANNRRSAVPWIIAMGHRPMYCSVDDIHEDCRRESKSLVRSALEELFYTEGVDLIISGHLHYYQRSYPMYKKKAVNFYYKDPAAPVHLTLATLGDAYQKDKAINVDGNWAPFTLSEDGKESFGRLKIFNATHLYWEVRECSNNKLVDQMWLIQNFHRPFTKQVMFLPPNPLGGDWIIQTEAPFGLESFLGLNGSHYGDDYQTKLTVLISVFVICVLGLIARKRILNFVRFCCIKKEPCAKMKSSLNSPGSAV